MDKLFKQAEIEWLMSTDQVLIAFLCSKILATKKGNQDLLSPPLLS